MLDLFLLSSILTSVVLIIFTWYLSKRYFYAKPSRPESRTDDNDDDQFEMNMDKRSLRPSYSRFMRHKMQQELKNHPYLCVICWSERKNVVLLPCKHLCVCLSCSQKLWKKTQDDLCPICRTEIKDILHVFV